MSWEQTFYRQDEDQPDNVEWKYSIEFEIVDEGIGPYEFWGAPGVDVCLCTEVVSSQRCLCVNGVETGQWEDVELTSEQEADFCESAEPPEPNYPEPSDDC